MITYASFIRFSAFRCVNLSVLAFHLRDTLTREKRFRDEKRVKDDGPYGVCWVINPI